MLRRNFVTLGGLWAGMLGCLGIKQTIAAAEPAADPLGLGPIADKQAAERAASDEQHRRDMAELRKFEAAYGEYSPLTISIPFATTPSNMYVRDPGKQLYEPKFEHLVDDLRGCRFDRVQRIVVEAYEESIKRFNMVRHARLGKEHGADRIVTPRLTIDVDELKPRNLATFIVALYRGFEAELDQRIATALAAKPNLRVEYMWDTPLEVYFRKEAFLLEAFSYVTVAGRFCPAGQV